MVVAAALATVLVGAGCDEDELAPPRSQLVVVLDTDAPLAIQALADPTIALDATVDTLRVDVFTADGQNVFDYRDFVVADPADWPVSFGIPAPEDVGAAYGSPIVLRVRLFRSELGVRETLLSQNVLEPLAPLTIERVLRLDFPEEGVARVGAMLSMSCMGVPSSFAGGLATCIDGERRAGRPDDALIEDPGAATRVGESPLAREVTCAGAPAGKVCIPGGFMAMGDADLVNLGMVSEDAAPLHPVRVSPFALDATEVTVAELRTLARRLGGALPRARSQQHPQCTWSAEPGDREGLAVNCVDPAVADQVCALRGADLGSVGHLPTEAQWEFAARGRGKGWRFPWGDAFPGCCVSALDATSCEVDGALPSPASHPPTPECGGLGDLTPDGVYDLGGGLTEITGDVFSRYDDGCWRQAGILLDPTCAEPADGRRTTRGGDFFYERERAVAAMRRVDDEDLVTVGFRCAYQVAR